MTLRTYLKVPITSLLLAATTLMFLGCNGSNSGGDDNFLPANPLVTHQLQQISITTAADGYILKSGNNEGKASIVNGDPSKSTMTLEQLYNGLLYAPTQATFEATVNGVAHQWTAEVALLSSDTSTRKSSFSFRMVKPVQAPNSSSQKSSDTLPSQLDQGTLILQDCPNEYPPCSGDYQCDGSECCPITCGTITSQGKVGYCWTWETVSCHPCQDYTSYCYSDGICGSGRLYCGADECVADNEPCYGDE